MRAADQPIYPLWNRLLNWASIALVLVAASTEAADLRIHVDANFLKQGLLKSRVEYIVEPGEETFFYYPQWIPGIHGPRNAIENLASIHVTTLGGEPISWRRDPLDAFTFLVRVPQGVDRIAIELTYLCNQPNTNSRSVDSYGSPLLGVINWNTCLLYPAGRPIGELMADLRITMPEAWNWGASLIVANSEGVESGAAEIHFEPVSFETLVDSPLIMGEFFRTIDLSPQSGPPHYLHLVADSERALHPDETKINGLRRLVQEGLALFGSAPFREYHFLLILSDFVPRLGLEHLSSSLNSVGEHGLLDDDEFVSTANLLSHEYAHSWCGKYHRPAGMLKPDFNTPMDTRLLWVYEGLDHYLGLVLAARAGLNETPDKDNFDATVEGWGRRVLNLMRQKGRRAIHLEDSASSGYLRRGGSRYWPWLNRPQDYYNEGALLWMEIDAILRRGSDGAIALDDFCEAFLGRYESGVSAMPFTEKDVVEALDALMQFEWQDLIDERVRGRSPELALNALELMGYRPAYTEAPTEIDRNMIDSSLGFSVASSGVVSRIVPGEPGDLAGLHEGMQLIGVNQRRFSIRRLEDAIASSSEHGGLDLITVMGERIQRIHVEYDQGPRYFDLVRTEEPDLLRLVFEPRVQAEESSLADPVDRDDEQ